MGRTTIFLGSPVEGVNKNTSGKQRPTWPDVDTDGNFAAFQSAEFATCKALALAAATDWDLIRVTISGDVEELVGPGRLLVLPPGASIIDIRPVVPTPATRLYSTAAQRTGALPSLAAGNSPGLPGQSWKIGRLDGTSPSGNGAGFIYNATAGTLPWWSWNGDAWIGGGSSMANQGVFTTASVNLHIDSAENNARATDYSPDGIWSFADYAENGALLYDDNTVVAKGTAYVTSHDFGNLGTAGDAGGGFTTTHFYFRFGELSDLFYGRLAVDVFDTDCPDWAPRLPPQRHIVLPALALSASGSTGYLDQILMTLPTINVESVMWTLKNTGGSGAGSHSMWATMVLPQPSDDLDSLDGVTVLSAPDGSGGTVTYDTILSGDEGAILYTGVANPLLKILMGSDGGNGIEAGSIITLTRRKIA